SSRSTWGKTALTSVRRNVLRFFAFSTVRRTAAPTASYLRRSSASIRSGAKGAGSLTYAMTSSRSSRGTEQYRKTSSRVAGRARDRRVGEGIPGRREIFALHMEQTLAPPRVAQFRVRFDGRIERRERLRILAERFVRLAFPREYARVLRRRLQHVVEAREG